MSTPIRRRLPPELLSEMHKCLPLADAIHVLVNVPSQAIYLNNAPRMRRTIQRIKTSLNEYIDTLPLVWENYREELEIYKNVEWKPQLSALLLYGAWLTTSRQFYMEEMDGCRIVGIPENFIGELLLHLTNSCSTQMMLQSVGLARTKIPSFLEQLFEIGENSMIGGRFLFESIELEVDDGRILHIYEGELSQYSSGNYELLLVVANKMDRKNWFQIRMTVDSSKRFIRHYLFTKWNVQPFDYSNNKDRFKQNGNKLEAKNFIDWNKNLDIFLRHGAYFSQFRHFKIEQQYSLRGYPNDYVDFLISYISITKHPEDFLATINMNLGEHNRCRRSLSLIDRIRKICVRGIPKDGRFINIDNKKLHILSAKTAKPEVRLTEGSSGRQLIFGELEFTLANLPTNGRHQFVQYIFTIGTKDAY